MEEVTAQANANYEAPTWGTKSFAAGLNISVKLTIWLYV